VAGLLLRFGCPMRPTATEERRVVS
jgi:hypothetical protein